MNAKRELRQQVLSKRALLTEEERLAKSAEIQRKVLELPEYKLARSVMMFLDFKDEVETTRLALKVIEDQKELVVPRCGPERTLIPARIKDLETDLAPGMWGIREPKKDTLKKVQEEVIDLVIVPGVAFDLQGGRLGYGGVYYDRFLPKLRPQVKRLGLAFSCQLINKVPMEEYDLPLDILITEKEVYLMANRH